MTPKDPLATCLDAFADRLRLRDSDLHQLLLDHLGEIDRHIVKLGARPHADVHLLITLRRFVACVRAYFHFLKLQDDQRRSAPTVPPVDPPDPGSSKPDQGGPS